MPRTKYTLPKSPKSSGNPIYLLLVVTVVAVGGWMWWHHAKTSGQLKQRMVRTATTANSAPRMGLESRPPGPVPHDVPLPSTLATNKPAAKSPIVLDTNTPVSLNQFPRHVQNVLEAQLALIQLGISSGSLDGVNGAQTSAAFAAYQRDQGLTVTGLLDSETKTNLEISAAPFASYIVTSNDLARLQPVAATWLGKSQQTALDYENILELVAEKSFSHPNLIRRLNPAINWSNVVAGTSIVIPNTAYPASPGKAAWVTIHLSGKILEAFDADTNLIAHFPCSIAKHVEKRPVGLLHVEVVAPNPNYTFDPDVFPESEEAKKIGHKLVLPPGPNNPVGVAWIGLDRPGYGIHGTPRPEEVGRTESHGCFRLANWNAEYLMRLITVGTPVYVVE